MQIGLGIGVQLLSMRLMNMEGLIHQPKYNYLLGAFEMKESYEELERELSPFKAEIETLSQTNLLLPMKNGANSKYSCLYCKISQWKLWSKVLYNERTIEKLVLFEKRIADESNVTNISTCFMGKTNPQNQDD